ncbi:MAG: hypothetical protein E7318_02190 [Clostridiales bacterium]|nr:hypothetical protein [Clostridiales bacterium]
MSSMWKICKWITGILFLCLFVLPQCVAAEGTRVYNEGMRLISVPRNAAATDSVTAITAAYITCDHTMLRVGEETVWTLHLEGAAAESYTFDYMLLYQAPDGAVDTYYSYAEALGSSALTYAATPADAGKYIVLVNIRDQYEGALEVQSTFYMTVNAENSNEDALASKVAEIVSLCKASGAETDYAVALFMHDYLINNADYDETYSNYFPDGVLLYGSGVCQSYATAYQILMEEMGIECLFVVGTSRGENHAWNIVKLDGIWYQVDCTWDDPIGGSEQHAYFLVTDEVLSVDHVWDAAAYPECVDTRYLVQNDIVFANQAEFIQKMNALVETGKIKNIIIYYSGTDQAFNQTKMMTIVAAWMGQYAAADTIDGWQIGTLDSTNLRYRLSITLYEEAEVVDPYDGIADDFAYRQENGGITIVEYLGNAADVVVPEYINGLPVISLGSNAFCRNTAIKTVKLPNTLTTIEPGYFDVIFYSDMRGAFLGCTGLTSISIPGSVKTVSQYTFMGCTALAEVTLMEGVEKLELESFAGCSSLRELQLPSTMQGIGQNALNDTLITHLYLPSSMNDFSTFAGGDRLQWIDVDPQNTTFTSVDGILYSDGGKKLCCYPRGRTDTVLNIPEGCETAEVSVIRRSSSFVEIRVPSTFYGIEEWGENPAGLEKVVVAGNNPYYTAVDGVIYSKDMKTLVCFPPSLKMTTYQMPDSVTQVSRRALERLQYVKRLVMSANLADLTNVYMGDSPALETVIYPESSQLTDIPTLQDCISLKHIQFPPGIKRLETNMFLNCTSLKSIVLPEGLEEIGYQAFFGCTSLQNMTIPSTVITIGLNALHGCHALELVRMSSVPEYYQPNLFTTQWVLISSTNPAIEAFAEAVGCYFTPGDPQTVSVKEDNHITVNVVSDWDPPANAVLLELDCEPEGRYTLISKVVTESPDFLLTYGGKGGDTLVGNARFESGQSRITVYTYHGHEIEVTVDLVKRCTAAGGEHAWGAETVTSAPSCEEPGETNYSCTVCGDIKREFVKATGHEVVVDAAVEPACTEAGLTEGSHCGVCLAVLTEQEVVAATGHDETVDAAVEPTCISSGLTEGKHCTVCNEITLAQEIVPATGVHTWDKGTISTPPTCTSEGAVEYHCLNCDAVKTEIIDITHAWDQGSKTTEQTCSSDGVKSYICTICGATKTEQVPPHFWADGVISTAPTASAAGVITYTCQQCGATKDEPVQRGVVGDTNGDALVDMLDVIDLMEWFCSGEIELNLANGDVNGDSLADMRDIIMLMEWYCGAEVELYSYAEEVVE